MGRVARRLVVCLLVLLPLSLDSAAASSAPLADRVLVEKGKRQLTLLTGGRVLKSYKVALGGNPVGPKERKGDLKTPEGHYFIASRKADSRFHLALRISYPGPEDLERAARAGVATGGNIMIHGLQNGREELGDLHSLFDWTQGCIAVNNREIEEIWRLVPDGTPIEIRP